MRGEPDRFGPVVFFTVNFFMYVTTVGFQLPHPLRLNEFQSLTDK